MVRDGVQVIEFHREQRNLEDAFIDVVGAGDDLNGTTASLGVVGAGGGRRPECDRSDRRGGR